MRLEQLDPSHDLSQEDYAESWAWVHFLLATVPEHRAILREYLHELRSNGSAAPISARLQALHGQPEQALLLAHLRSLVDQNASAVAATQ